MGEHANVHNLNIGNHQGHNDASSTQDDVGIEQAAELVELYLECERVGVLEPLAERFAGTQTVRNAAAPTAFGPTALADFCTSFWSRTKSREFELIDVATTGADVFAFVMGTIEFREGAAFGPVVAVKDFVIELPFTLRFHLDEAGDVDELDVMHETTSAVRMASGS